jgi:predicted transposase YbfD/YdcC
LLSAILHQEGIVVAQRAVGEKSNEIPELPHLLAPLSIEGAVVTADAMHAQKETARYGVEAKKADYLFTVKDNQPTLKQDIADLHLQAFPPSAHHPR